MAYANKDEYRAYQNEYAKKRLVMVTVKLHKENDNDIIEAIKGNNAGNIKRLVRIGISKTKEV